MKIYVINFRKVRKVVSLVLTIVISIALTAGILITVDGALVEANNNNVTDMSKVIILDAGHGGEDCGAVGVSGIFEKDLNLSMTLVIAEQLRDKGYTVILTREEDKLLYSAEEDIKGMRKIGDLKNRCKIAAEYPGATLISIHMNSFGAAQYSGLQVYHASNSESTKLATLIQSSVKNNIQPTNNRVVKNGEGLYILENSPITSVLIECGFLTNEEECLKLSEKEYQNQLSSAIICGIIEYIENKPK